MFFQSALTSSQEIGRAESKVENDEAKSGNIYSPSACAKTFLRNSSQEIRVAQLNGESHEAEFDIEMAGDVSEATTTETAPSNKISTFGLETRVDGGLGERDGRYTGWIFPDPSPDWYSRQKECGREPDQRGEQWLWEAGGDCPA
jgi:hypothetical protein